VNANNGLHDFYMYQLALGGSLMDRNVSKSSEAIMWTLREWGESESELIEFFSLATKDVCSEMVE